MTHDDLRQILRHVACPPYAFAIGTLGDGWYLRVDFDAESAVGVVNIQHGRKWYVSPHAAESEVVQTALKAVLTAAEHEIREAFRYHGHLVYGPHLDVHALIAIASHPRLDVRAPLPELAPVTESPF